MRGQLFSLDLLITIAVLTFSLGSILHYHEVAEKRFARLPALNSAETITEAIAAGQSLNYTPSFCYRYSNGTTNCGSFSCTGNTLAARKVLNCTSGVCLLEVKTCG